MPITHISDTARWVAYYRAMESERPDAIFHDPYARRLAGPEGEAIVRDMKRGEQMAWALIVRTALFDEMILARVRGGVDLVVNLAAGLDARPWRLDLPPKLRWVDVDLPDILQYKTTSMAGERPACDYEAVPADLARPAARGALLSRLALGARNALVVSEGLLIYLEADDVAALARDLHAVKAFRWWLIDLASPRLLAIMQRMWGRNMARGNAPFRFAPAEGTAFFAPLGWREAEYRSQTDEARRLDREMPGMWFYRLLGRLMSRRRQEEMRRMSGFVLMERDERK